VKIGVRIFLVLLFGALVLAVSPAALGDEATFQLVTPNGSSNCSGFTVETVDGTISGCTRLPDGVTMIHTEYSAAADGSIVFMADDGTGGTGTIWLVKPDGSSVHLDDSAWDFAPTISYDGSKVVFARYDSATGSSDLYSVNSDGSGLQLVVSGGGTNYLRLPSISLDGSAIAYWCGSAEYATSAGQGCGPLTDGSYREEGVMRVDIDGSNPRMIVIGPGNNLEPVGPSGMSWSPDGQWLALDGLLTVDLGNNEYTTQRQLFEYHTDGSDLFNNTDSTRQITHDTVDAGPIFPQFTPDGSELLFMKTIDDNGNQGNFSYLIGVDGTNRHEVSAPYGEFIPTATPVAPPSLVDMMHITVPSVDGLDLAAATNQLAADDLTVGTVTYEYSETVGQNLVVSQYPSAGSLAHRVQKQGPPVDLVVSLGAAPTAATYCVVPRVRGKSLKATKPALRTAHCQVGQIKHAFSRRFKRGRVISAKPGAGRQLPDGAKVALTVSKGRRGE
jgi:Tol biopolymer transport system component